MSVLVTGSHACVGGWVLEALVQAGQRPAAYDLSDDPWRARLIFGRLLTAGRLNTRELP